ncbi:hypothetical protein ERD78_18730 [Allopusillimonas soli]|uniref:Uncharacterized protein n=1 Tax=Allopusillimonas soli TaxID=659016 RepID=A0A853FG86_9BURK|nr:hypothetical protein [Allopusillimonas soli]NYT38897.1 hypothetical protein [Allopusillimonas soli]TEA70104.1 hypothetical protein ERD78_18730 [Allopusillimonas soli]
MDNPFGDSEEQSEGKRRYLMLISAGKDNAKAIQKTLKNIQDTVDKKAWPLWVDSKGIGVFMETDLVAWEIRQAAFDGVAGDFSDIKDAMLVEVGADWYASEDSAMKNWLKAHVGAPLVPPLDSRLRRRRGGPK